MNINMGFELTEKTGELIADFGLEKIREYKTKADWKALFVDTGEFLVQNFERADKLFDDMAIVMSKTNMIELANSVKDTNGFELKSVLMKKLENLMHEYEIPQDVARSFVIQFFEVIIADIKMRNPEKYQEYYFDRWHEENKAELSIIQGRIEAVYDAVKEVARCVEIYSMDSIELQLLQQTENPSLGLDFFEIDDEIFQKEFENSLGRECIFVKGQCREETIYCLLNELRRLKVAHAVFVIKSQEDWEKFRQTSVNKRELQGKILVPWFNSYEITAIPNNINIFVFGKDDYCLGKEPIEMKKRTRKTIIEGLEISGADYQRASDLWSDTHGLFIPLKKKLLKGINNIVPTWVNDNKNLVLPVLLCEKWQDNEDIFNLFKSYAEICIENMNFDVERWIKMITEANNIDLDSENKLFDRIEYELDSMNDAEKILIKETLRKEIYRHRFYKSAIWSLGEDRLKRYEDVMSNIHTDEPEYEYRYLFGSEHQFPLLHPMPYDNDSFDERKDFNKRAMEDEIKQQISDFKQNKYNLAKLIQVCDRQNSQNLGYYMFKFYSQEIFDIKVFEDLLDNEKEEKRYCIDYLKYAYSKDKNCLLDAIELSKKKKICLTFGHKRER